MSNKTLTIKNLILRNDTAANWTSKNPILAKGEMGVEIDTRKLKVGDGVKTWSQLSYINLTELTVDDLPDITLAKVTDAGTAASKDTGTAAGNIPVLDANGKLAESVIPALAITETSVVASEAAMKAITAQKGDIAIRTDVNKTFVYDGTEWKELRTPTDAVLSVNGKTGAVTLTSTDVAEGTNLYYTDARVEAKVKAMNAADMTDGAKIVFSDDTITLDCGNA